MHFLKKYYGLILVLILSFWTIKPFFDPGFFPMHDDTQVARVFEMEKVLRSGVFPVRVVPDLGYGYGYPIFNFYAPLAYYIGAAFMLLGFDALAATKLMMALGTVLAGIFMYLLGKELFGKAGGLISGMFYLYAPYHAVNIYVRGDVAEFWAYAFIPLAFLGFYKKNILLGTMGFAALILSHNLTALMVTPFLLIMGLLLIIFSEKGKRKHSTSSILIITFLGLAISAFYWLPALLEIRSTNVFSQIGGGADFRDHFVCVGQLWGSIWGFGGSARGCVDGMSLMLGKLHILSVAASILTLIYLRIKRKDFGKTYYLGVFSIVGFLVSVFLMLEISRFIWEAIPVMAFFQYPWRFLILGSFFASVLSGFLIYLLKQMKGYFVAPFLVLFILVFNLKFFVPQTIVTKTTADYTSEDTLKWTVSKISDEFLAPNFNKPKNLTDVYRGPIIQVTETPVEKASNLISLIGLLALIIGIIQFKRKYE